MQSAKKTYSDPPVVFRNCWGYYLPSLISYAISMPLSATGEKSKYVGVTSIQNLRKLKEKTVSTNESKATHIHLTMANPSHNRLVRAIILDFKSNMTSNIGILTKILFLCIAVLFFSVVFREILLSKLPYILVNLLITIFFKPKVVIDLVEVNPCGQSL